MSEKHLEFIQGVIERMARNSFQAKTWGITTTSALFGFLKSEFQTSLLVVLFPISLLLVFGTLDASYLYLERAYRSLYNTVISGGDIKDFDMKPPASAFGYKKFISVVFSKTIGGFYSALIVLMIVLFSMKG